MLGEMRVAAILALKIKKKSFNTFLGELSYSRSSASAVSKNTDSMQRVKKEMYIHLSELFCT